jgi:hypothetical protein
LQETEKPAREKPLTALPVSRNDRPERLFTSCNVENANLLWEVGKARNGTDALSRGKKNFCPTAAPRA